MDVKPDVKPNVGVKKPAAKGKAAAFSVGGGGGFQPVRAFSSNPLPTR